MYLAKWYPMHRYDSDCGEAIRLKSKIKTLLAWVWIATIAVITISGAATTVTNQAGNTQNSGGCYANISLSNQKIKIAYTDKAVSIGNYTDDTYEPTGWELFPSIFWDSNNNVFEANESIGHMISPCVHFTHNGQTHRFWPLHQSIMQEPGDPNIVSSGWISYSPPKYASKVEDANKLITIETVTTLLETHFKQQIKVASTANATITNVNLIVYIGIDINGPFNNYAFIDPNYNNMLKACNNQTGVWFGAFPNINATDFEISEWNDGPYEANDLWQRTLNNSLDGTNASSGDVEAALKFDLGEIETNKTQSLTIHYLLGTDENDLNAHAIQTANVAPHKTVVGQGHTANITVTIENQGTYTETFDVTCHAGQQPTSEQKEAFWSLGDVNRDNYINMPDSDLIMAAYGSYPGHPRWNPDADLNQDLHVNTIDVVIWTTNEGKNIWTHFELWLPIQTQMLSNIPLGMSTTLTFTWNTTGFAYGNYTISAYALPVSGETDTLDNTFVDGWALLTLPGDINGDKKVNILDAILLSNSFNTKPGDAAWNPNADINGDLKVNILDAIILAGHFNQKWP